MNHKGLFIENSSLNFIEKSENTGFGEKIPCSSGSLASYTCLKWMEVHVFIKKTDALFTSLFFAQCYCSTFVCI
jgi:hypothetical protein